MELSREEFGGSHSRRGGAQRRNRGREREGSLHFCVGLQSVKVWPLAYWTADSRAAAAAKEVRMVIEVVDVCCFGRDGGSE